MKIHSVEMMADDVGKVFLEDCTSLFVRFSFLSVLNLEKVLSLCEMSDEEYEDLVDGGLCFACERKAEDYLARCEQSRFGLTRKLIDKGYDKKHVEKALDFLEAKNYLSDRRFASSWLRMHCSTKLHGRTRLLSELLSRGISRAVSDEALDELFETLDEEELCRKAYEKASRKKEGEKLLKFMLDSGFTYKMVLNVQKQIKSDFSI